MISEVDIAKYNINVKHVAYSEYNHTMTEVQYWFGAHLYIVVNGDNYCVNGGYNGICVLSNHNKLEDAISKCKHVYRSINKSLKVKIEELEEKRDSIMNYCY